jgi:hypothetical protein
MSNPTYRVFTRRPWRRNAAWPGGWEPFGGARKTTLERGLSLEEAKRRCAEGNKNVKREPGARFHEFESE